MLSYAADRDSLKLAQQEFQYVPLPTLCAVGVAVLLSLWGEPIRACLPASAAVLLAPCPLPLCTLCLRLICQNQWSQCEEGGFVQGHTARQAS